MCMCVSQVFPRVLSSAWSNDGKYLALGHENGKISIRDNKGAEKVGGWLRSVHVNPVPHSRMIHIHPVPWFRVIPFTRCCAPARFILSRDLPISQRT